jgi:hypothetical protein
MAKVLKMATVADIVTWIEAGHSDRRISAVLSLDCGTVAKYRRQLQAGESPRLPEDVSSTSFGSTVATPGPTKGAHRAGAGSFRDSCSAYKTDRIIRRGMVFSGRRWQSSISHARVNDSRSSVHLLVLSAPTDTWIVPRAAAARIDGCWLAARFGS